MDCASRKEQDWYAILEIEPSAGPGEVKAAHRRLARRWHPDTNASPEAHDRMIALNRAREVLLDPVSRASFDRARRLRAQQEAVRARVEAVEQPVRTVRIRTKVRVAQQQPLPATGDQQRAPGTDAKARRAGAGVFRADPDFTRDWFRFLGVTHQSTDAEIRAALGRAALALQAPGISAVEFSTRSAELRTANASIGTAAARAAYHRRREELGGRREEKHRAMGAEG